jgi:hypothetical protein
MATKNIKLKPQEEDLSDINIKKVIALMEPKDGSKPITKTLACQILRISYNTKRLDTIISSFKEKLEMRTRRMAENRGKPATKDDVSYVIREYLASGNVSEIARSLFRGVTFVNNILEEYSVPIKPKTSDYFKPEMIPEALVATEFAIGEKVYSARYDSLAQIKWESSKVNGERVYNIFLLDEKWMQHAYQPASELAKLDKLREAGVSI